MTTTLNCRALDGDGDGALSKRELRGALAVLHDVEELRPERWTGTGQTDSRISLSLDLSFYLSIHLSIYLSIYIYIYIHMNVYKVCVYMHG